MSFVFDISSYSFMRYLIIILMCISCTPARPSESRVEADVEIAASATKEVPTPAPRPVSTPVPTPKRSVWSPPVRERVWRVESYEDMATGKTGHSLWTKSRNLLSLDRPYSGPQNGRLVIRDHPRYGRDVYVAIQRGQIISCRRYGSGGRTTVRFDNGPAKRWPCDRASDGSSATIFLRRSQDFIRQLRRADKVYITFTLYRQGDRTLEFNAKGVLEYLTKAGRIKTSQ